MVTARRLGGGLMRKISVFILTVLFAGYFWNVAIADEIHDAARGNDVSRLAELLDADGSAINSKDINEMTPLHHAVEAGSIDAARFLLTRGADVNALNIQRQTPLHIAAYKGNAEATSLLLKHGADITKREMRGRIPLTLACGWGRDPETVRILIEAGSDVNDGAEQGQVFILLPLDRGLTDIVNLLLDSGSKIPDDPRGLIRVIYLSTLRAMERPFSLAVEKCEAAGVEWWKQINMHYCATGGSVVIAEKLVSHGVLVDDVSPLGIAAIHIAAELGHADLVEFLLSKGVDINLRNNLGQSPYNIAMAMGHSDVATLLESKGASTEPQKFPLLTGEYLGQTPPGEKPAIFAPGIVSARKNEHSPAVFSPDGNEVYWNEQYRGAILYMKQVDGIWTAPAPAPFCTEHGQQEPVFSPDGRKLFYLSFRPMPGSDSADEENMWFVERTDDGWTDPRPVSDQINDTDLYWTSSVAANGTIYFATIRNDGYGRQDIYRSRFIKGEYQEPENLGAVINGPGFERTPHVAPDESYIIYASTGKDSSLRQFDILVSFLGDDGLWSEPVTITDRMETGGGVLCPVVTPDQKYLFFISRGDIYWMDAGFIKELQKGGNQ